MRLMRIEYSKRGGYSGRYYRERNQKIRNSKLEIKNIERNRRPKCYECTKFEAILDQDLRQKSGKLEPSLGVTQQTTLQAFVLTDAERH